LDTKAIIVLPDWPKFKAVTKELKLIKQFSEGEKVFMKTTPTCTCDPFYPIPTAWPIDSWLIDANTPVLSQLLNTDASNLKSNVVTTELKLEVAIIEEDNSLSTTSAIVIMDPYQAKALMRFTATVSYKELSSRADTLIDVAASLSFDSKQFGMDNGFYKEC
jgi:hypothetical protein